MKWRSPMKRKQHICVSIRTMTPIRTSPVDFTKVTDTLILRNASMTLCRQLEPEYERMAEVASTMVSGVVSTMINNGEVTLYVPREDPNVIITKGPPFNMTRVGNVCLHVPIFIHQVPHAPSSLVYRFTVASKADGYGKGDREPVDGMIQKKEDENSVFATLKIIDSSYMGDER